MRKLTRVATIGLYGGKKPKSDRERHVELLTAKYKKILHPDAIQETVDNLMPGEDISVVIQGL